MDGERAMAPLAALLPAPPPRVDGTLDGEREAARQLVLGCIERVLHFTNTNTDTDPGRSA